MQSFYVLVCVALCSTPSTLAGPDSPPNAPASTAAQRTADEAIAPPGPLTFSLATGGEYTFDGTLRNGNGNVNIARVSGEARVNYEIDPDWRISLGVNPEYSWYRWSNSDSFGASRLDAYSITADPSLTWRIDDEWSALVGGFVNISAESGASAQDAWTAGGLVGVRYAFTKNLAVTGGIIATSRLEDSTLVVPLVGLEWSINDRVRVLVRGLGAQIDVDIAKGLTASLYGEYQSRENRLQSRGPIQDPILRDRRLPVGVKITYAVTPSIDLEANAGAVVYQYYRFDDKNGSELANDRTRPTGFVGGKITFRF